MRHTILDAFLDTFLERRSCQLVVLVVGNRLRRDLLLRAEERRAFQMIDADGSGHLDLQEFQEALKERANLVLEDDLMAAVWRSYDDNNNGILDYRKFVGQVMNACAPPLP